LGSSACDLSDQLRADRLLKILAVLDRQHKGARAADNAILVVPIKVIDIHCRIGWLLYHDWQAVDDDAFGQRLIANGRDRRAVIVRPVDREDEHSYVLTGTFGALLGDDVVTAQPGMWVFKPREQWHTFWNAGDVPCEIIEVISPGGFEDYFRELREIWPDRTK